MAIVYIQQKKVQRNLILVLFAVILISGLIVWQVFFGKEGSALPEETIVTHREEVKINFEVFKNPLLQSLQLFSDIQPFKGSTTTLQGRIIEEKLGRENPFLPY
ncbi:MAG: hypothetical protein Q7S82_02310 [bacterium]|nr:hypothetical protein [bacterium]